MQTETVRRELVGAGINAAYRRTPFEWMELIIDCLSQLQEVIDGTDLDEEDSIFIMKNVSHIKRYYEELEREFFRSQTIESSETVQSNMTIHF
jgi:hypothetical protein